MNELEKVKKAIEFGFQYQVNCELTPEECKVLLGRLDQIKPRAKMVVYIASPYTVGDVAMNVRRQIETANQLVEIGCLPYVPLLSHFWHLILPHSYEFWTEMDMDWLEVCDCILRLPGESKGADAEAKRMRELGKPVYYSIFELEEAIANEQIS